MSSESVEKMEADSFVAVGGESDFFDAFDVVVALGGGVRPYVFGVDVDGDELVRLYGSRFREFVLHRVGGATGNWQVWVAAAGDVGEPQSVITSCFVREVVEFGHHREMIEAENFSIVDYLLFADLDLLRRNGIVVMMRGEPFAEVLHNEMDVGAIMAATTDLL